MYSYLLDSITVCNNITSIYLRVSLRNLRYLKCYWHIKTFKICYVFKELVVVYFHEQLLEYIALESLIQADEYNTVGESYLNVDCCIQNNIDI